MPGPGYLNPGTIVQIKGSPTDLSNIRFQVLSGSGEITYRLPDRNLTREITPGSSGFFFCQGHKVEAPYDWGTLDTNYFQVIEFLDEKNLE